MRNLLLLFILLASLESFGQEWPSEEFILKFKYEEIVGEILTTKEQIETFERPVYPRGKAGIKKMISKEIRYPQSKANPGNKGVVQLKFIVDKQGKVVEIEVEQSAGWPFDQEAIRVLNKMERWIPGKVSGEFVKVQYRQLINFL